MVQPLKVVRTQDVLGLYSLDRWYRRSSFDKLRMAGGSFRMAELGLRMAGSTVRMAELGLRMAGSTVRMAELGLRMAGGSFRMAE